MAEFVNLNSYLTVNAVDLSNKVRSSQINGTGEEQDKTAMGASARSKLMGLKDASIALEFNDDLASGSVDATLWAAYAANVAVAVAYRAVNAAISTTNPEYQFNILPTQWVIGGSVGVIATKSVTYPVTDSITRDVTP